MSSQHSSLTSLGPDHPYADAIEAERLGWYELITLVRALTPEECMEPGYYHDPDWAVRDVVAHLGTWLAEAEVQFERINAGTYEGHDVDIDGYETFSSEAALLGVDVERRPGLDYNVRELRDCIFNAVNHHPDVEHLVPVHVRFDKPNKLRQVPKQTAADVSTELVARRPAE